jgi:hypothetical protein
LYERLPFSCLLTCMIFIYIAFQYVMDVFNSGMAYTACYYSATTAMRSNITTVLRSDQLDCIFDYSTLNESWIEDPCCNTDLQVQSREL